MSFSLELPPQDLRAMQRESCQATMFISSGLPQNAGA